MNLKLDKEDIEKISRTLGVEPVASGQSWVWNVENNDTNQKLIVSVYKDAGIKPDSKGILVSVQSINGFLELHGVSAYMIFEPDEIIFMRYDEKYVSTLVVGRGATCSLYSNISRELLKNDLTELDAPVLLSVMQIALAESEIEQQ